MRHFPFEKNYPSLSYIVNNWPRTKPILKKYILSKQKKPNFYRLCLNFLNDLNIKKLGNFKQVLKKLSNRCSFNFQYNTYHDQHHFKTVLIISCLLAKLVNLNRNDRILVVLIALTHDLNHQGRRVIKQPYYQEDKSALEFHRIIFKNILNHKKWKRINKVFRNTFFPMKPNNVNDNLEKIILDADILASLMFGVDTGIEFATRLKHEIRFEDDAKKLFGGFLNILSDKSLYLDSSKDSC